MFKKLLFLFLFSSCFTLYAQCPTGSITIRSQADVNFFLTQYPNCTELPGSIIVETNANSGAINDFNGFRNITRINGGIYFSENSPLLRTLNGFENLTYVGGSIFINHTWLHDISGIRNLTHVGGSIDITNNHIGNFSALNNITYVGNNFNLSNNSDYCSVSNLQLRLTTIPGNFSYGTLGSTDTNLTGLGSIVSVGGNMTISNWELTSLQGLSALQTVTGGFKISSCIRLQNLNGINSLTSIGNLYIGGNYLLTDISSLYRITTLPRIPTVGTYTLCIESNRLLTTLYGLHNLTSITGGVMISNHQNLNSINDLSGVNFTNVNNLTIRGNQYLALCQELNICNYLFQGGVNDISGNAVGCNSFTQLIESCNIRWKNNINGTVRMDFNNNGCSASDRSMENIRIMATSGSSVYNTFTNANGEYSFYVPQGNYNVTSITNLSNYTASPSSVTVNFAGVGNQQTVNFCNVPNQTVNDVRITFHPLEGARPGFENNYIIYYENKGTTIMNGTIDFEFDDSKMDFISSTRTLQSQITNKLTWSYANLYPYQSGSFIVKFKVIAPPTVNAGDLLPLKGTINPIASDFTPTNNIFSMNQLVVNSFDPNDKTVLEGDTILVNNIGKHLNYVVRFQNTGTASAVNVKITDILDSKLDPSTFELIGLSHAGRVQIKDDTAEFIFNNINLPDATSNEPGSHGYISYRIKPKSTTVKTNIINNTASIYFDYNAPIITNTVSTYVDADTDNDTVYDSKDNCVNVSNTNQSDIDNDEIGDVCDDGIEVNAPYYIGFDTPTIDSFWKTYRQTTSTTTSVAVSNQYDVDNNGNTIKLYSYASTYKTMLISPRLNNLSVNSVISFWIARENSSMYPVEVGFMTDPTNPATFTRVRYAGGTNTMAQYTLNMSTYQKAYGKNLAILVYGNTVYIDDFKYELENLSTGENEFKTFNLYPNPATNFLNIESEYQINSLSIYDLNGRKLKSERALNEKTVHLNINDLSKGIYIIEIESGETKQIQKFIKE